jgi:nicotinamidase-related amidase
MSICLILIDLQAGFGDPKWGERNNVLLERNVALTLAQFRERALPVVHVRHDSLESGSPLRAGGGGFEFLPEARPSHGERIFTKRRHGAFVGTGLERYLRWKGITEPVFAGLTTDHCVSTSMRMAHDLGFHPKVLSDATATFARSTPYGNVAGAQLVHDLALASLDKEFGDVVTVAQLKKALKDQFRLTNERSETVALKNLS